MGSRGEVRLVDVAIIFVASAVLAACSCGAKSGDPVHIDDEPSCFELSDGQCVEETFANPPVLEPDANGVHQLYLDATEVTFNDQRHCVRTYNGAYGGPTIDTPARDGAAREVRIDMGNRLVGHDFRSLLGNGCTCTDSSGVECVPEHVHNGCADVTEDCTCLDDEGAECEEMFDFNVTNLHAHGSHVRPDYARGGEACAPENANGVNYACRECGDETCDGDTSDDTCFHGDNVLNAIHPLEGARYRWDIDEDGTHHTGLQWYHPHIHGTTAIQVGAGAAGAWIVRGELDELDGIRTARERVIVFSTPSVLSEGFVPLADGEECTSQTVTFNDFNTLGSTTAPQMNIVNGLRQPRMITAPEQVERWRIVHAGFLDEVWLGLFRGTDADCSDYSTADEDTLALTQIGRDGLILPQTFESPYFFLAPGYRFEAMLGGEGELADGETWCLVSARFLQEVDDDAGAFEQQPMAPNVAPTPDQIFAQFDNDGDVVLILNVTDSAGAPTETKLPDYAAVAALGPDLNLDGVDIDQYCADAAAVSDPEDLDQAAVLQVGFVTGDEDDPCDCAAYNVNCNNFETTDRSVYPVDRDMMLDAVEHWRVRASVDGHPFHIHINPFIVCPTDNPFDPLPFPHWRDTYLVNLDREIDLIVKNKSYTGPFVFHCHKLTHEDHGMMEVVRVCDPDTDPTCGDYDWRACADGDLQCLKALASTDCALSTVNQLEAAACQQVLGGPLGICGPLACADDPDCEPDEACEDNVCTPTCLDDIDCALQDRCDNGVCLPAPCPGGCPPGQSCEHGVCL